MKPGFVRCAFWLQSVCVFRLSEYKLNMIISKIVVCVKGFHPYSSSFILTFEGSPGVLMWCPSWRRDLLGECDWSWDPPTSNSNQTSRNLVQLIQLIQCCFTFFNIPLSMINMTKFRTQKAMVVWGPPPPAMPSFSSVREDVNTGAAWKMKWLAVLYYFRKHEIIAKL